MRFEARSSLLSSISVVFDAAVVGLDLGFEQKEPALNSEVTLAVQRPRVAGARRGHALLPPEEASSVTLFFVVRSLLLRRI